MQERHSAESAQRKKFLPGFSSSTVGFYKPKLITSVMAPANAPKSNPGSTAQQTRKQDIYFKASEEKLSSIECELPDISNNEATPFRKNNRVKMPHL